MSTKEIKARIDRIWKQDYPFIFSGDPDLVWLAQSLKDAVEAQIPGAKEFNEFIALNQELAAINTEKVLLEEIGRLKKYIGDKADVNSNFT